MLVEDLHNSYAYSSLNIIRANVSKSVGCVGHIVGMAETKTAKKTLSRNTEGNESLGKLRFQLEYYTVTCLL
jgi:hypothetical protein